MAVFKTGAEKRKSFDYRRHYLKHNRGIFGSLYFCSQCLKPLKEDEMEVDHIFPNSKWFSPNRTFNCVAICPACNKRKTDKIGWCTVKGLIAKAIEELFIYTQRLVIAVLRMAIMIIFYLIRLLWSGLMSGSPTRVLTSGISMFLIGKYIYNFFI